tara:strand:+ start:251 stop:1081 length:831 start_codon:yes stop_codon:yes gene_type:complete
MFIVYSLKKPKSITESFFEKGVHFKILVPFYNPGSKLLDRCLKSIENQTYKNFQVCLIDDASTDDTVELHKIIDNYCSRNKNFTKIIKKKNKGTLHSNVMAMQKIKPKDMDVIVIVDGDDQLYDNNVFEYLANTYKSKDVYVTFGNYVQRIGNKVKTKKGVGCKNKKYWDDIAKRNVFREHAYYFTHLKTFRYILFKNIKKEHLMKNGEYLRSSTDQAIMYPIMELSGGKFKCIEKPLYIYTRDHVNSHHNDKEKSRKQKANEKYVRSLPKYKPVV